MKTIVLIDGENFLHKLKEEFGANNKRDIRKELVNIKLSHLLNSKISILKETEQAEIRYYSAKLSVYKPQKEMSNRLIEAQRKLKRNLENQGIKFIITGHVRPQNVLQEGKVIFKEKGVDVKIAVDMISLACDKLAEKIILCSSDSDLQPAVKESRKRGIEVVYLGFQSNPNKGLKATTDSSILLTKKDLSLLLK